MSRQTIEGGSDFVVVKQDRSFGGRDTEIMKIDGDSGRVSYATDVTIQGQLVVNGQPIYGGMAGGSLTKEVLGRPMRLSRPPTGTVYLFVNGQLQDATDFTVVGQLVSWRSQDFEISASDKVEAMF